MYAGLEWLGCKQAIENYIVNQSRNRDVDNLENLCIEIKITPSYIFF